MEEIVIPAFNIDGFNCPHCGAYSHMTWRVVGFHQYSNSYRHVDGLNSATCAKCDAYSLWLHDDTWKMFYPAKLASPAPHSDMPDTCVGDYQEARAVFSGSPRAAAALLRLCVQRLCKELGQPGKNINDDIAALVRNGLPVQITQALDVVRVTGNNAVHPGEMSEGDTAQLAGSLFGLVNFIVDSQIAQPKRIQEMFDKLPEGARAAIEKRDT
uniref:DUF4145 domain-containing protein n=1 Tax=Castellaniella defragrans TaxID=75697 RepID=UPI00333FFC8A